MTRPTLTLAPSPSERDAKVIPFPQVIPLPVRHVDDEPDPAA